MEQFQLLPCPTRSMGGSARRHPCGALVVSTVIPHHVGCRQNTNTSKILKYGTRGQAPVVRGALYSVVPTDAKGGGGRRVLQWEQHSGKTVSELTGRAIQYRDNTCLRTTNFGWVGKNVILVLKPSNAIIQGQHNPLQISQEIHWKYAFLPLSQCLT